MKRKNIIILAAVAAVVVLCVVLFGGSGNSEKKLIGQWSLIEGRLDRISAIEFFSDGTYSSNHPNYNGSYSVDGDRIRLSGILMEPITCSYKVSGNKLSFYSSSSSTEAFAVFEKR